MTNTTMTATYLQIDQEKVQTGYTIADLNRFYSDGNSADQNIFAEMRSNLLLVSGEHYQRRDSSFYRRLREVRDITNEQKLRLTKNHTRKICQSYVNNIMAPNPGVGFMPKNEQELHDQKVAELHHAVWRDAFDRYNIDDLMDDWCDNFVELGETHVKIFWDPSKGPLKGYDVKKDENGQPIVDVFGQPQVDEDAPIHAGEFCFEEVYGFNLLRPPECRDLRKAEWLCIRKMVSKDDLILKYKGDPDKLRFIQASSNGTYMVFDASYGGYYRAENQVEVREYYFRPSLKFSRGKFQITTKEGILEEGELPAGIFPIVSQIFDKIQTTSRGRSPIKQIRPYQIEINRAASKMAEHQITLGDDKLLIQNGTKVSSGVALPGIRSVNYTGAAPTVLSGRSGEQYLNYMNTQIDELYKVMNVFEDTEENQSNLEPWLLLFRAARQKKKFQRYIKRFEKFLIEVVKTYLRLAKYHLPDDQLIYAIGAQEQVNIPEFKQMDDICYEIKVEAQSDDIETKMGKQMTLNHILQYTAGQLKPDDIGKFIREMPYANVDGSFDDMTLDYDVSTNDILALDRGEQPPVNQYDNHVYCIKRLTKRMRQADFKFLSPQIQNNYAQKTQLHQQFEAQRMLEIQRAEQGFIPTAGYLVTCDFYVTDPGDKSGLKTRRARLPYQSVEWLIKQLEAQGQGLQQLEAMDPAAQQGVAQQFNQMAGNGSPPQQPMGGMPQSRPHMNSAGMLHGIGVRSAQ